MRNLNKIVTKLLNESNEDVLIKKNKDDDEDIDLDVYGGVDDGEDLNMDISDDENDDENTLHVDLDDDEVKDLDDVDDTDISDDPDAIDGQSINNVDENDPSEIISQLHALIDTLANEVGDDDIKDIDDLNLDNNYDDEDMSMNGDDDYDDEDMSMNGDDDEDMSMNGDDDYDDEDMSMNGDDDEDMMKKRKMMKHESYDKKEKSCSANVKKAKSMMKKGSSVKDASKKCGVKKCDMAELHAYAKDMKKENVKEENMLSPMKLSVPNGQDGSQKDLSVVNGTPGSQFKNAKSLPRNKKVKGNEGVKTPADVLNVTDKARQNKNAKPLPTAKSVLDVVKKMLNTQNKIIQANYKGKDLKKVAQENLEYVFDDDIKALDETFSPEFVEKASQLFATSVKSRVEKIIENVDTQFALALTEETAKIELDLEDKVNKYMDYVVENYFEENKVAIEEGVEREINDSFMNGLKKLFERHYIEVPKSKINLVNSLKEQLKNKDLEIKKTTKRAISIKNENINLKRRNLINECAGNNLSVMEKEKFVELTENVSYENDKQFKTDISKMKRMHFNENAGQQNNTREFETTLSEQGVGNTTKSPMDAYVNTIRRFKNS